MKKIISLVLVLVMMAMGLAAFAETEQALAEADVEAAAAAVEEVIEDGFFAGLGKALDEFVGIAGDWAGDKAEEISAAADEAYTVASDWAKDKAEDVSAAAGEAYNSVSQWAVETATGLTGALLDAYSDAQSISAEKIDELRAYAKEVLDSIDAQVNDGLTDAGESVKAVSAEIRGSAKAAYDEFIKLADQYEAGGKTDEELLEELRTVFFQLLMMRLSVLVA